MDTCFKTYQMYPWLQRIFFSPVSNSLGAGVLGSLFGFCGVPEKALIQPFSLSDSILTLNFELVRKTDVTNWKTSLESHHFDVLQTLNLSQFLCWTKYSRCFLHSGFFCVFLSKKEFLSPKLRQRTYWQWQNDRTCGFKQAFRDMSTYNKKPSCIANLLIYFTRRGLARMCFCFTVIATLVSWTNIRCNRFFFNRIWLLCVKLDPKERFKSICLDTINWRRWRGCDRL